MNNDMGIILWLSTHITPSYQPQRRVASRKKGNAKVHGKIHRDIFQRIMEDHMVEEHLQNWDGFDF